MIKEPAFDLVRLRDAARALGISQGGLRNLVHSGRGPRATRIGRLLTFERSALEQYVRDNSVGAESGAEHQVGA